MGVVRVIKTTACCDWCAETKEVPGGRSLPEGWWKTVGGDGVAVHLVDHRGIKWATVDVGRAFCSYDCFAKWFGRQKKEENDE